MYWTAVALALASATTQATPPLPPPGYTLPATQCWDMTADTGDTYRIFVSLPEVEPPAGGFPVLYVLDGNAMFAGFAEARRIQERTDIGKVIIVGIGYPTDKAYDVRRLKDYTPPLLDPPPPQWRQLARYPSGGRKQFLDFLTGRLRSEIARRYAVNPGRQSLFGHSLGGLFGLYALYERPQAFTSIIAASPSIEWNNQGILPEERAFAERLKRGRIGSPSRLLIVAGALDRDDDRYAAEAFARRMDRLSGYGVRARFRLYEEEVHVSVPSRAVTDTLRYIAESG